ncbi:MAG: flavin reductase family protein [Sphingobacteriaceae bacterium]|nr:MAG: flavin reductase family protein [Sphingobacteriaceae bacterium]
MKTFNAADLSPIELQNYLQYVVAPRPIALVSTIDAEGNVNLSPFSFFNLFSMNPPVCVFSPSRRIRDNTTKHTLENLQQVPECVIHIVTADIVHQTSLASTEYAKGVNEFDKAGFTAIASEVVKPPRVAESNVQMECKVQQIIPLGDGPGAGNLVLAEIVRFHISEELFDNDGGINQKKLNHVARLGGDWYAEVNPSNLFKVPKPVTGRGIGFDNLPDYIRLSKVLSGNDLSHLANVDEMPSTDKADNYLQINADLLSQLDHLAAFPQSRVAFVHQRARRLIEKDNVTEAWLTLLAGNLYEEKELHNTVK